MAHRSAPHRASLTFLQNHHLNNLNIEKTRPQRKQPAPAEERIQSELLPVLTGTDTPTYICRKGFPLVNRNSSHPFAPLSQTLLARVFSWMPLFPKCSVTALCIGSDLRCKNEYNVSFCKNSYFKRALYTHRKAICSKVPPCNYSDNKNLK